MASVQVQTPTRAWALVVPLPVVPVTSCDACVGNLPQNSSQIPNCKGDNVK